MKSAILFLVFNRPDTTQQVFETIATAKPPRLYIAADGPRKHVQGEDALCRQTRSITDLIHWDCKVSTLFRDENLGCKNAVSGAIDWFFSHEEEGIILEDDCLPDPSFFTFCDELLEYYRHDNRVGHICGNNFQDGISRSNDSYYFSKYAHIWGWASWRRAWKHYDVSMRRYPDFIAQQQFSNHHFSSKEERFWNTKLERINDGTLNTWDYQWMFTLWCENMLSIIPQINLVSNIGFGNNATHTSGADSVLNNISSGSLNNTLKHPDFMIPLKDADIYTFDQKYNPGGLLQNALSLIKPKRS